MIFSKEDLETFAGLMFLIGLLCLFALAVH